MPLRSLAVEIGCGKIMGIGDYYLSRVNGDWARGVVGVGVAAALFGV
jgi:hypothetical protein